MPIRTHWCTRRERKYDARMTDIFHLWGEDVRVLRTQPLATESGVFDMHHVSASDDTHAMLIAAEALAEADVSDMPAFLRRILSAKGLSARFEPGFIAAIDPLHDLLLSRFPSHPLGVIVLINGTEPGALALDAMSAKRGDRILVLYKIGAVPPG